MDQLWVVKEKSPQLQVFWPEQFLKCLVWSMEGPSRMVQMVMNLPATQETQVRFLGWEDIWRKEWLPTQVFLPREFHGQRSLAGYSPCGCKELDNWATNTFFVCAFFFFFWSYPWKNEIATNWDEEDCQRSRFGDNSVVQFCTWWAWGFC